MVLPDIPVRDFGRGDIALLGGGGGAIGGDRNGGGDGKDGEIMSL